MFKSNNIYLILAFTLFILINKSVPESIPSISSISFKGDLIYDGTNGMEITLIGSGFGINKEYTNIQLSGQPGFSIFILHQDIISLTDTEAVFKLSNMKAMVSNVTITVHGIKSEPHQITIRPLIEEISQPPLEGGEVTITGKALNTQYSQSLSQQPMVSVKFGDRKCFSPRNPVPYDYRWLVCTIEAGLESDQLKPLISIDNITNVEKNNFLTYNYLPLIEKSIQSGNMMELRGKYLLSQSGQASIIMYNGLTLNPDTTVSTAQSLVFKLPENSLNGPLLVYPSNGKQSNLYQLQLTPVITNINPRHLYLHLGGDFTIYGDYLSTQRSDNSSASLVIKAQDGELLCKSYKPGPQENTIICDFIPQTDSVYMIVSIDGIDSNKYLLTCRNCQITPSKNPEFNSNKQLIKKAIIIVVPILVVAILSITIFLIVKKLRNNRKSNNFQTFKDDNVTPGNE
ncbi:IPT/TIG domain-containing protein [Tieghemostelium lacteum]|uniref:IPT/TIG domain-containing protein n=1 Tax=Tieghemostelium lacteum TaxID=361077 RepID=A0A152A680_TIELA|nr:IPT/TIG domain-containing protein [Tieghemostelium lacteum]|eukprot:KYR01601.1 IPT/TIG domain-containing protein [Tieghemostelium lacteum]